MKLYQSGLAPCCAVVGGLLTSGGGRAGFVVSGRERGHSAGTWRPLGPLNGPGPRPAPPPAGPGPELRAAPGRVHRRTRGPSARHVRRVRPGAARPADTRPADTRPVRSAGPGDTQPPRSGSGGGATPRRAAAGRAGEVGVHRGEGGAHSAESAPGLNLSRRQEQQHGGVSLRNFLYTRPGPQRSGPRDPVQSVCLHRINLES